MTSLNGEKIYSDDGKTWKYVSDDSLVSEQLFKRKCGHCKKYPTEEGHDGCLGTLKNVMNACCGHGVESDMYVQKWDGDCIRGAECIKIFENGGLDA